MYIKFIYLLVVFCFNFSYQEKSKYLIPCSSSFPNKGGCFDDYNKASVYCPIIPKTYVVLYNLVYKHTCYCCS